MRQESMQILNLKRRVRFTKYLLCGLWNLMYMAAGPKSRERFVARNVTWEVC
jgi:hypothetical protein